MGIAKKIGRLKPRTIFLIDGLGALLTATLLGGVLAKSEDIFGIPVTQLYALAAIATLFAVYSMTCYFSNPVRWRPFLKAIAIANLVYCCVTLVLVCFLTPSATSWGMAYFGVECMIVGGLVYVELRRASGNITE